MIRRTKKEVDNSWADLLADIRRAEMHDELAPDEVIKDCTCDRCSFIVTN